MEQQHSESCMTLRVGWTIECFRQRKRLPFAKEFIVASAFLRLPQKRM